MTFFLMGNVTSKDCFVNAPCEGDKICSHYSFLNDAELSRRFEILKKEYDRPWTVKGVESSSGNKVREGLKKLFSKVLFKTQFFNSLKNISKKEVVLNYKGNQTKFFIYEKDKSQRVEKKEKKPLLIIIPPIYDISPFDTWQAVHYAGRGYKVAILDLGGVSFVSPFKPIKDVNKSLVKTLGDVHRLIEYMTKHSEVDKRRIGIFGFSLGGALASLAFSVNPDIKALSTVLAAGKFAELMTNSRQEVAALYRAYRKREEEISTKDYLAKLKESILFDPVYFAHLRNPSDVYMVFTEGDTAVPSKNQKELESAFCASPEKGSSRWEKGDHFQVIVKDLFKREHVDQFFKKKLKGPRK
jgi:dienelactone hydrolase